MSPSNWITNRVPRQAPIEVEHPFAPDGNCVVRFEELERTRRTRPLKGAEDGIIGVSRVATTEERLCRDGRPQRREYRAAKLNDPFFAVCAELFERRADALLPRFAEIDFVLFAQVSVNVGEDE